jgi:flagellar hook-length control protein FliK
VGSAIVPEASQANADKVVSSARLTQQAGNAEMQVRLRSEALGPIDVHTIVKGGDIGASIRVEARDTQVMLANELSQLERALNARSLRVERLDVLQGSVSGGRSNGTGPGNSYGSPSEPRPSFSSYSPGQTYTSLPEIPNVPEDWGLGLSTTRINLRV